MTAIPVFKDGIPLFRDNGGGVLVPAHAVDPCECCGTVPDCCNELARETYTITVSGVSDALGCDSPNCQSINGSYVVPHTTACVWELDITTFFPLCEETGFRSICAVEGDCNACLYDAANISLRIFGAGGPTPSGLVNIAFSLGGFTRWGASATKMFASGACSEFLGTYGTNAPSSLCTGNPCSSGSVTLAVS